MPRKRTPASTRFRIAEEFRLAGVFEGQQVILEYLKVLTVVRPKPGKQTQLLGTASFRLAECLEQTDKRGAAMEQYQAVVAQSKGTRWIEKAQAALKRLTPIREVKCDAPPEKNNP